MKPLMILFSLFLSACAINPFSSEPTVEERCLALVGPPGDAAYDSCIEQLKSQ